MIWVQRYVLVDLDVVYTLQDGKSMADAGDSHLLEFIMTQRHECLSNDFMLCQWG